MSKGIDRQIIVDVVRRMRSDPARQFHTIEVARQLNVSASSFIEACREVTGLTPSRFRSYLRVDWAKRLLTKTDKSVTDIALDVGYDSFGTFVRRFTSLVGIPPTALRKHFKRITTDEVLTAVFMHSLRAPPTLDPLDQILTGCVPFDELEVGHLVAIGLFREAAPVGAPISGCILPSGGRFDLRWPATISHVHLLALQIPIDADNETLWMPSRTRVRVATQTLTRNADSAAKVRAIKLSFRAGSETDPPIVVPIPVLLGLTSPALTLSGHPGVIHAR